MLRTVLRPDVERKSGLFDPFVLIQAYFIVRVVVKLGCASIIMAGEPHGVFKLTAVEETGCAGGSLEIASYSHT